MTPAAQRYSEAGSERNGHPLVQRRLRTARAGLLRFTFGRGSERAMLIHPTPSSIETISSLICVFAKSKLTFA